MKELVLMMGGPGSGKSYVRKQVCPELPVVDCDEIKKTHPDYDPKNPGLVHQWSSRLADAQSQQNLIDGVSFVMDGTGRNSEKYVRMIREAHEKGYRTRLLYVACSVRTALERNAKRERTVPEDMLLESHAMVTTSFEIVARYVTHVQVVNND